GLEFLVGELAEAEDGVVHDLRELAPLLDAVDHDRLEFFDPPDVVFRSGGVLLEGRTPRKQKHNERQSRHGLNFHSIPAEHRAPPRKELACGSVRGLPACLRGRASDSYQTKRTRLPLRRLTASVLAQAGTQTGHFPLFGQSVYDNELLCRNVLFALYDFPDRRALHHALPPFRVCAALLHGI